MSAATDYWAAMRSRGGPANAYLQKTEAFSVGFFSKLKKVFKVVAPIAASFIPGVGGIAGRLLSGGSKVAGIAKVVSIGKKVSPILRTVKGAVKAGKAAGARVLPGIGHVGNVAYAGDVAYRVGSKVYRDMTRKRTGTGAAKRGGGSTVQVGYFASSKAKAKRKPRKKTYKRRKASRSTSRTRRAPSAAQKRARANFVRNFVRRRR